MSEHDNEKAKVNLIDRVFGNLVLLDPRTDAQDILSEDLEKPDWHLKYARNIINLIVFFGLIISLNGIFFPNYFGSMDLLNLGDSILLLIASTFIGLVCGLFDKILDQESDEVQWFNYARFWFVLLSVGFVTLYIGIKVVSVATF